MQEALDRFDEENDGGTISRIDILDHLSNATFQVDNRIINYVGFETIICLFFQEGDIEDALALTKEMLAIGKEYDATLI